jgi:hypothetical protein
MLLPPSASELFGLSDEGVASALRRWAGDRRDLVQAAQRAYDDALLATYDRKDMAGLHAEVADLWLGVLVDTRRALLAAAPEAYRADPVFVSATQGAEAFALRKLAERIAANLDWCARLGGRTTCAQVNERYAMATDPRPVVEGDVSSSAVAASERPVIPTSRPRPCTFRGTLVTRGAIYAGETGDALLLPLGASGPIEVEALDAPAQAGGRYKVSLTWPRVLDGYLAADEPPLVLTRQVVVEGNTAWASEGTRVDASDARGPTVRLMRAVDRARPESVERRFFCHDLELATSPKASSAAAAEVHGAVSASPP